MSDVTVKLDERVRLMSAILAATNYPEQAQKSQPHGTHAHARATRKFLNPHKEHPVVIATQGLVDQSTPMEALFQLSMSMAWPGLAINELPGWAPKDYNILLQDFYEKTGLEAWWKNEDTPWQKALREATDVFKTTNFHEFLIPFLGKTHLKFQFIPNVSYPANYNIGFKLNDELLICIAPPPLAWGDSPPWPYNEQSMLTYTIRAALTVYGRILLKDYLHAHPNELSEAMKTEMPVSDQFRAQHPGWEAQFSALFLSGVVAMYLEAHIDEGEYKAYMLMQKKARGMAMLPGTVSVLRRYLQEVGGKYENFMQFLPIFPKQLRVAKRIVTF